MNRRSARIFQTFALATLRFVLLGAQAGAAVGLSTMFLMCLGGCGGYGEVIYGAGFAVFSAFTVFVALMVHFARHFRTNPEALARQARRQWLWLGVSGFVLILFL